MKADSYALSPMQQGMLFQHLKEQHVGIDIEQLVVHTPDLIDPARMRAAWAWLVDRHDVLRTRFEWEAVDEPRQQVETGVSVPFEVTEGGGLLEHARLELLKAFLKRDRRRGFELDVAPLLRLTLFQWQTSSSLVWTFHHALIDGRCFPELLSEVFQAYEELAEGDVAARPAPPAYRQYIEWLQRRDPRPAESFWHDYLTGITAPTSLVVDRLGPSVDASDRQGETWHPLDAALTSRLHAVAREHGVTLNTVVMAAWAILLHRYSSEVDVLFGATRACRQSSIADAPRTIGLFINTVPVRVRLHGDVLVSAVMAQVRHDWVAMRPFEHAPLARVKALAAIPASQPLFESLLVFENYGLDTLMRGHGGAWAGRRIELHELTNVPLTLAAYDGEELSFKAVFDRHRLDDATIERWLGHLHTLLEAIAANPATPIRDLPLLTEAERVQIVEAFNRPRIAPGSSAIPADGSGVLHELFEAQVRRSPTAVAVTCDGRSLSYAELNAAADRVAGALIARGAAPDALVGLAVGRSTPLVIGILGILKAGAAYLPIDQAYPPERVAFILGDAGARLLLADREHAQALGSADREVICLEDVLESTASDAVPVPSRRAAPDDLAYVIYTSGTTGKPKGSLITHRNVVRLFSATDPWFGFHDRDVWTLFHSCAFDFSVWELWGALLYGGRLVVVPFLVSRSPEAFRELLVTEGVTVLNQTPSAFRQLMQADEAATSGPLRLRYVIFGGEALEMQSLRSWFDRHGDEQPRLINMYGITETTVHVTYRPLARADVQAGSVIGVPIPDLRIFILDPAGHPVPIGVPGELYVGGAGLARGYLRRPELTTERFVPDHLSGLAGERLYRTGDLARFLPTRDIEYLGRIDHQVKVRGFRIELGEIESVLCQRDDVREAVVLARDDEPGNKRLVAYVVPARSTVQVDALRAHLATLLPPYMVPAAFVVLDAMPLTTNGKVDRKALKAPDDQRSSGPGETDAPQDALEQMLSQLWSQVLKVRPVGLHDNFFDLGGHSILALRLLGEIEKRQGQRLPLATLLQAPTVAQLADVIRRTDWQPSWSSLVPIRPGGWKTPLFLMHSHGGNVLEYYPLAKHLDHDLPVYALQARGLDGRIPAGGTMQEMAAAYLEEITTLQPEGPYYVGGFCFGGVLALEIAQQLTASGHEVRLVVLIQATNPQRAETASEAARISGWYYRAAKRLELERQNLRTGGSSYLAERVRRVWDVGIARTAIGLARLTGRPPGLRTRRSTRYILEALGAEHDRIYCEYAPRPYHGDVVLLRASRQLQWLESDRELGWQGLMRGRFDIVDVPGHQQNMMREPNVRQLAHALAGRLGSAAEGGSTRLVSSAGEAHRVADFVAASHPHSANS